MTPSAPCDWVFLHAARTPDAPAVASPEHRLSYSELAERVRLVAAELVALGVNPGERVLLALPNVVATVVVGLAVQYLGAVNVEVSRELGDEQLEQILEQCAACCAVLSARDAARLGPLLRSSGLTRALVVQTGATGEGWREPLSGLRLRRVREDGSVPRPQPSLLERGLVSQDRRPAELIQILYTSGSTGRPRGVMQTLQNIAANTRSIAEYLRLTAADRAMLILPLSYCYGKSVLQTHLFVGGSVFLDRRFMYPQLVLQAMAQERCTGFAGVPLTFELLRRQASPDMNQLGALRYVTQAGGRLEPHLADWVRETFAPAKLFIMYGQTEATARLSYLPPERSDKRGSIGVPVPGVELRIVDEEGGELPPGAHGELLARGANITPGYYRMPAETAQILREGWLRTGDLGYRDEDGFFFLFGRAKEILKVGGHRVSPAQIEAALGECDAVVDVGVAGVPDELLGEVPVALVVARQGATLSEVDVRRFCAAALPPYMVPKQVRFTEALPRGPSGKLLRGEISKFFAPGGEQQRNIQ